MLEIVKKINQNNGQEISVKTNEGEFIISKELSVNVDDEPTLDLFIGSLENAKEITYCNGNTNSYKQYTITNEDFYIYSTFVEFVKDLIEDEDTNEAVILSEDEDYEEEEKSSVRFILDEEHNQVIVRFKKSKSKTLYNTYIVKKSCIDWTKIDQRNIYINNFFNKLVLYQTTNNQITIFEALEKAQVRTRNK